MGNNGTNGIWSNIVAANMASTGIAITGTAADNKFTDYLLTGNNNNDCDETTGVIDNPGVDDNCTNSSTPASNFTWISAVNLSSSFMEKRSDDASNATDDANGQASFSTTVMDWLSFANSYRDWGISDANGFPHANHKGKCVAAGTCQVWDFRLATGDTVLRNHLVNATAGNEAWVENAACPNGVSGTAVLIDQQV